MDFSENDRHPKIMERKRRMEKNKEEQVRNTAGSDMRKNVSLNKKGEHSAMNGKKHSSGCSSMKINKKCFAVCAENFLP